MLSRPRLFHLIDALRHLLKLGANRGERLQDSGVALGPSLGGFDATREFLCARLPPSYLRAQRTHIIALLRRPARHRPHVSEQSTHNQANQEKNKRHTHSGTIQRAMHICVHRIYNKGPPP